MCTYLEMGHPLENAWLGAGWVERLEDFELSSFQKRLVSAANLLQKRKRSLNCALALTIPATLCFIWFFAPMTIAEYAILTNIIHQEWTGVSVKKHKAIKGLQTQNLRDHMSEAELIFTALAELSTRQIAESVEATGLEENADAGKKGGRIAKRARQELEQKTGRSVVTGENFLPPAAGKKEIGKQSSQRGDDLQR